ncbi:LLM class oxidoreductase [Janthinobacterium sp. PLB04]|uniref:LLM class oxidoreductase n=1 Tax=Janthinobacterium lividum TaxID=29581 RepID=A0AAJ4MN39_9BURK|nr:MULTISPECIES: LLM class oxidoreductase [Janthinobacterium]KAB0324864.1 LLM class oxidoreductase [Janthinobacterium lividum]QSX93954.1 LLM class oxidoreductase [Janthinobacterium lividum]UGQ33710.1 LLM class oxidoreductase [Janthinobacterium sp. PLB04]
MSIDIIEGASSQAFTQHRGYRRMFAPGALTLGIYLPLRFYQGDMRALAGQADLVAAMDRQGFAAAWVRDIPLFDPRFGDAGQLFDPWTYLAYLAARTDALALATGSAIFTLRHPIDLAKAAASIDQLSGGRLVLGTASGDRASEFPAYGVPHATRGARYAQAVHMFRQLLQAGPASIDGPLGSLAGLELLPKPVTGVIPLVVTSSSGQPLAWIGRHADGWLTYPEATDTPDGPRRLADKIRAWRQCIPDGGFRPHMCNEWLDLVDDPDYPRTPVRSGYVLRTGRKGLIDLLGEWREAGVNHAALGIQHGQRPAAEVLQELAEEVLPHFPSHAAPCGDILRW